MPIASHRRWMCPHLKTPNLIRQCWLTKRIRDFWAIVKISKALTSRMLKTTPTIFNRWKSSRNMTSTKVVWGSNPVSWPRAITFNCLEARSSKVLELNQSRLKRMAMCRFWHPHRACHFTTLTSKNWWHRPNFSTNSKPIWSTSKYSNRKTITKRLRRIKLWKL